jgi:hypothetical protein
MWTEWVRSVCARKIGVFAVACSMIEPYRPDPLILMPPSAWNGMSIGAVILNLPGRTTSPGTAPAAAAVNAAWIAAVSSAG